MITLLASGSNAQGQLATGTHDDSHTFKPSSFLGCNSGEVPIGTRGVLDVVGGANHTLLLLDRGTGGQSELWGCGDGSRGQLGPSYPPHGSFVFRPLDLPLDEYGLGGYTCRLIAAAWETTYLVLSAPGEGKGDVVVSMGANDFGDLGIGDTDTNGNGQGQGTGKEKPLNILTFSHIAALADPDTLAIHAISAGPHHVVVHARPASSAELVLVGWGASRHGQLGPSPPVPTPPAPTTRNSKTAPYTPAPRIIPLASRDPDASAPTSSALGTQHTVLLHSHPHQRVSALGSNRKSQLEGLARLTGVKAVGCTWNGTYVHCAGEEGGEERVWAAGSGERGQLGRSDGTEGGGKGGWVEFPFARGTRRVERMACGSEHVLMLFSLPPAPSPIPASDPTIDSTSNPDPSVSLAPPATTGEEVWGWGWNEHGNLGVGSTQDVRLPVKIWPRGEGEGKGGAVGVWAGCGTSWIAVERDAA